MGFYSADQLLEDARRHGLEIRMDVQWPLGLHPGPSPEAWAGPAGPGALALCYASPQAALRMGFRQIKGLRRDSIERLIQAREAGGPAKAFRNCGAGPSSTPGASAAWPKGMRSRP